MHQIRLSAAWQLRRLDEESPRRVKLPIERPIAGPLHFTRSFNKPTNLEDRTRVFLSITSVDSSSLRVTLNGSVLLMGDRGSISCPLALPIGDHLANANLLEIELDGDACLLGDVFLEITEPDKTN
ncbi:MAG: hypothetical protein AAF802_25475 [Planctomycetota bacterium]